MGKRGLLVEVIVVVSRRARNAASSRITFVRNSSAYGTNDPEPTVEGHVKTMWAMFCTRSDGYQFSVSSVDILPESPNPLD